MAFHYAPAIILCIDSSKACSGSALLVPHIEPQASHLLGHVGRYSDKPQVEARMPEVRSYNVEHFCEVKTQTDHENCVMHLVKRSLELGLPPIVAAETWTPGKWSFKTVLGMGEGWGWWTAELRRALEAHPEVAPIHVERVTPNQWRDDLFGKKRSQEREELKRDAVHYVKNRLGLKVPVDAAEAICVGLWGAQNDEVHRKVLAWHNRQSQNRNKAARAAEAAAKSG
jgi:hypothetical protein